MLRFVTLFNYKYLAHGLMMYHSLVRHVPKFKLYVFAFDKRTNDYLKEKNFKNIILVSFQDFEDDKLLKVKKNRTLTEYFWTCSGSTILYLFKKKKIDSCIYLDADLFFYDNPEKIINKIENESCMITRHNYAKEYDQSKTNGKFCVQFMYFKNNKFGNKILNKWRQDCLKWCFNKIEDGKFGDQKYLDIWPVKYKNNINICSELGAGLAPWNSKDYQFTKNKKKIEVENIEKNKKINFFFYHFHGLKFYSKFLIHLGSYKISNSCYEIIYKNYIKDYLKIFKNLENNKIFKNISLYSNLDQGKFKIINFFKILKNYKNIKLF